MAYVRKNEIKYTTENELYQGARRTDNALLYATDELKNNKEVIFKTLIQNIKTIKDVNKEFLSDKEFVLEAMKNSRSGYIFEFANEKFLSDKEVVLEAIKNSRNGYIFEFANEKLRNDKEVVREAVKQSGFNFRFASEELRDNKEYVLELMKLENNSIEWMSQNLLRDKEVQIEVLKTRPDLYDKYTVFDELKKEVGNQDPVKYLEAKLHKEQLEKELTPKQEEKQKRTMKI